MEKPGDIVMLSIEVSPSFTPFDGATYHIGIHRYKILKSVWTGFCAIDEIYDCKCKYLGQIDEPNNLLKD